MSPSMGALIYALVAIVPPLIWVIYDRTQPTLTITSEGVMWAIATVISFGTFTGLLFFLFSQGVNLSIGTPIIRLGGITVAAALGVFALREGMHPQYLFGFVLAAVGILLIATA